MDDRQWAGYLSIVLGLIFIVAPVFSGQVISFIVGLSLLFFGIVAVYIGFETRNELTVNFSTSEIIIGIISIIFGFLFLFYLDALSFLIGLQLYIVGFIMIAFGLVGVLYPEEGMPRFGFAITLLMGILSIIVAAFSLAQPTAIAIIIGIVLIIEGIALCAE